MFDFNAKPNQQEKTIIAYLKTKHKKSGLWYETTIEKIAKDFNTTNEKIENVLRSIKDKLLFDIRIADGRVRSFYAIGLI